MKLNVRFFITGLALGILLTALYFTLHTPHSPLLGPPAQAVVGTLDISGTSQSFTGDVTAARIVDSANSSYFIDPAASGTSLSLAGAASISGSLTLPQGAAMRPAFGPTTLSYKSGFDAWGTGLIIQDGTGNVGIGTTGPGAKLEVAGQVKITGGSPGASKVLTSDAAGLASWVAPAGIPTGGIIMYTGAWNFDGTGLGTGALAGWALANGNNGTPNLTDRFVLAASAEIELGATGGANSYSLATAQLPSHTHTFTTNSDGSHVHSIGPKWWDDTDSGYCPSSACNYWTGFANSGTAGAHTHSGTTDAVGSNAAIDNRPAFLRLAYIMKL